MCEIAKLRSAVANYAYKHGVDSIPYAYYDRMVATWSSMNNHDRKWNRFKAAAALLCIAHRDGYIHETQITPDGLKAMGWAEHFQQKSDALS